MTPYQILLKTVAVAKIHEERLRDALDHLKSILPISKEKTDHLTSTEYAYLDVMAVRYSKLQNLIGGKIFKLLLDVMQEQVSSSRFLDILAHLEKIGILESVTFWINLRNVRNFIAYEYPEEPDWLVRNINVLYESSLTLLGFWKKILEEIAQFSERSKNH
jgi:hypothetical protein